MNKNIKGVINYKNNETSNIEYRLLNIYNQL